MFATKLKEHDDKLLERGLTETAVKMLKENAEISFISRVTGLSVETVKKLKEKINSKSL